MLVGQRADPDVLRLHQREVHARAPGGVGHVDGVTLAVAPGRHQAAARAGAVEADAGVQQHGGVADVALGKVIPAPGQVDRPLPAAGEIPVARSHHFGGHGFSVVKVDVLEPALQQVILLQRILQQRDLIGQIQLLFRRRHAGAGFQAVTAIVEPGLFPGAFHPRADVGGVTDTGFDGIARTRRHQRVQRQNLVLFGIVEIRGHHHRVEPVGGGQTAVQLGQILRTVVIPLMKGHQILQIVFADLRTGEFHLAEAVTFAAVEIDIPKRLVQIFCHAELAFGHIGVEVAFAQRQAGQRAFETVILAVVEDLTDGRPILLYQRQVVLIGLRAAFQHDVGAGDAHRFARIDLGMQHRTRHPRPIVQRKLDGRLVIAERAQPLAHRLIHPCAEATVGADLFRRDRRQPHPDVFFQLSA
ncbi:Uncharacterised protein [Acinetobacter baumannii]|nr:Uncharacterised protein [Acinetobacter baumannii]